MDLRPDIFEAALDLLDGERAPATPLQDRTLTCRSENAAVFRALRDAAEEIVENLEAAGPVEELGALFVRFGELERLAGDSIERLGALLGSCGTA